MNTDSDLVEYKQGLSFVDDLQSKLVNVLASQQDEYSTTKDIAHLIKIATESAGCKFFIVEACSENGVKIVRLHSTANSNIYERQLYPVNEEKGLAEWVIYNKAPLIIDRTSSVGQKEYCSTEERSTFVRYAVAEDNNASSSNDEKALVIFPIIDNEESVIGVFAIWRQNEKPYSETTIGIVKSLSKLIFILCNHIRQLRLERKENEFYTKITQKLTRNTHIADAYQIILQEISELYGANHSLLVEQDKKHHRITYSIATHSTNKQFYKEQAKLFKSAYTDFFNIDDFSNTLWKNTFSSILRLNPFPHMNLSAWHIESDNPYFAKGEDIYANWGLYLFTQDKPDYVAQIQADKKIKNSVVKRVFGFSHRIFSYYLESFIREQIRLLGGQEPAEERSLTRLLNITSRQLLDATQADVVVTYTGDFRPQATYVLPEKYKDHFDGIQAEENSYSQQIIESAERDFLFDASVSWPNKPKLRWRQLQELQKRLEWEKITSWQLSCIGSELHEQDKLAGGKVISKDIVVHGAFKLLTESNHLSHADFRVLNGIARRTHQRYHQQHRGSALEALNSMSNNLATLQGSEQAKGIVKKLKDSWIKSWIRPDCDVGLVAFNERKGQISQAISEGFKVSEEQFVDLANSLNGRNNEPEYIEVKDSSLVVVAHPHKANTWGGVAISMAPSSTMEFDGFLVVLSKKPFCKYQVTLLQDAAKELAVLLHQEKKRHDWSNDIARFRHAIKSPVNFIASNAEAIFEEISPELYPDVSDIISDYLETIKSCSKRIENWSDWQRVEEGEIQLKVSRHELKPLLLEWISIHEKYAKRKNINIKAALPMGSIDIPFDREGLEISFSNLLDNAIKYAPDLSTIFVKMFTNREHIFITVTNLGEAIPSRLHRTLFEEGVRGGNMDGRRATPGQGMGLALSKALIEAHEGARLEFTQTPSDSVWNGKKMHSVTFKIILRHFWRGAKRKS